METSNPQETLSTNGSTQQERKWPSPFPFGKWMKIRSESGAGEDAVSVLAHNAEFVAAIEDMSHKADVDEVARRLGIDQQMIESAWFSWRLWLQTARG